MRDIKFRGKGERSKKWIYGSLKAQTEHDISCQIWDKEFLLNDVQPSTIGQYTGLKDKNGVEIYEGDILQELSRGEYAEATGIPLSELEDLPADAGRMVSVVYNAPSFEFAPNEYGYIFLNNPHLFRVIGNVHENHELMKGGSREA